MRRRPVKFSRQLLPLAMLLLVLLALPVTLARPAKSASPPVEQVKAPKVLYIIKNPEEFRPGIGSKLLQFSYDIFADALKDKHRIRTQIDGTNYETCLPGEQCDRVVIQRSKQTVTVMIRCGMEVERPRAIRSGEFESDEEIIGILKKIVRVVGLHDEIHK